MLETLYKSMRHPNNNLKKLVSTVATFYKTESRDHLPWRPASRKDSQDKTPNPYHILVSEMMLQQTQVDRVIPKYTAFIKTFPTVETLAAAPLSNVLLLWSGLGYNRRAKYLHDAAKVICSQYNKKFPKNAAELEKLPGVGPYTARAISTFAYNQPEVFIETNIRTVFTHFCFAEHTQKVSDAEILPLVARALKESKVEPRDFYAALMDYGSHLKRSGVRINNKSKHYTKQSKFEGSVRQLRGAILRELLQSPKTVSKLQKLTGRTLDEVQNELRKLQKEKLLDKKGSRFVIKK